ncbi:MAG: CvpA family protein [Gammaproteobacteria bacterium]|nr:CvpA family protein [Gammaproteobacteria bacterium]
MTWIDIVIILIIFLSAVISSVRGFAREALSLFGWILAFWVSMSFSGGLSAMFIDTIQDPILRLIVAFLILFIASLIVSTIVNYFIIQLVLRTGMTGADRSIGVVFGVLRGILIVTALVMFSGLTPFPQTPSWDNSFFMYYFEGLAVWLRDLMPSDMAHSFKF